MARAFALIAPILPVLRRVSGSNKTLTKVPEHYKNAPEHEVSVQRGGSGAFIAKNSDAISWNELLH